MADIIRLERLREIFIKYMWMTGRIGRLQLGGRLLGTLMAFVAAVHLINAVFGNNHISDFIAFLMVLLFQWFILCSLGQRTHDIGYYAWLTVLYCIPIFKFIYIAILLMMPGDKEANEYGPPPLNKGKKVIAVVFAITLLILSISIFDYYSSKSVHQVKNITYAELLQDIKNQQVDHAVIFSDNTFRGTLKTNEIILVKIPADHSALINTLQRQNVNIRYEEAPKPPWWRVYVLGL